MLSREEKLEVLENLGIKRTGYLSFRKYMLFLDKIEITTNPNDPWKWLGKPQKSAHKLTAKFGTDHSSGELVHRVAYKEWVSKEIPEGHIIRHKQGVPDLSCNPFMLEIGTPNENSRDIVNYNSVEESRKNFSHEDVIKSFELAWSKLNSCRKWEPDSLADFESKLSDAWNALKGAFELSEYKDTEGVTCMKAILSGCSDKEARAKVLEIYPDSKMKIEHVKNYRSYLRKPTEGTIGALVEKLDDGKISSKDILVEVKKEFPDTSLNSVKNYRSYAAWRRRYGTLKD